MFLACRLMGTQLLLAFLVFGTAWADAARAASAPPGKRSLRMELGARGTLIARPPARGGFDATRILLEKPGGMLEVVASLEKQKIVSWHRVDFDEDGKPELLIIARSDGSTEVTPLVFSLYPEVARLYPAHSEESPILGRTINLATDRQGAAICVQVKVLFHDFGPPHLFRQDWYRWEPPVFRRVHSEIAHSRHFNHIMNRGGLAFHEGQYREALRFYEDALLALQASPSKKISEGGKAEALFFQGECRKYLKDLGTAMGIYQRVVLEHPSSPLVEEAQRAFDLLRDYAHHSSELGIFLDISSLDRRGQWTKALAILDTHLAAHQASVLLDHFLLLRGKILIALGRLDEAIEILQSMKIRCPQSALLREAEEQLQELEGHPEEGGAW